MSNKRRLSDLLSTRGKWAVGAIGLIVVLVALWAGMAARRSAATERQAAGQANVQKIWSVVVTEATYSALPQYYEATGTVRPRFEAELAARVMGRVVRLDVREGDTVTAGQPLVWLDSRDLKAAEAQASAGAQAARVGADTAAVAARMERSASAARVEAARALVRQSEAALEAARARLDLVKKGPRKQEKAQAALAVAQAKAALELAEADYERMAVLLKDGAVSKQQADAARTQRDVARARHAAAVEALNMAEEGSREEDIRAAEEGVRQAQAALDAARQGLRQTEAAALMVDVRDQEVRGARAQVRQATAAVELARTTAGHAVIRAPFSGVVARRMADPGDMATPGMPLLTLHGGGLRLEAVLPETVLKTVKTGDTVSVLLDALGDRDFQGQVVEISPQGDPSSHTFIVRAELPSRSGAVAGNFGRARFATGTERALTVPSEAIREREGLHYVFIVTTESVAQLRLVTTGATSGGRTVVLSGLSAGERVVVAPPVGLVDGAKVRW